MEETKFLRPAEKGMRVVDPVTNQPLAADGEEKPWNSYWARRVAQGDCIEGQAPSTEEEVPAKKGWFHKSEDNKGE